MTRKRKNRSSVKVSNKNSNRKSTPVCRNDPGNTPLSADAIPVNNDEILTEKSSPPPHANFKLNTSRPSQNLHKALVPSKAENDSMYKSPAKKGLLRSLTRSCERRHKVALPPSAINENSYADTNSDICSSSENQGQFRGGSSAALFSPAIEENLTVKGLQRRNTRSCEGRPKVALPPSVTYENSRAVINLASSNLDQSGPRRRHNTSEDISHINIDSATQTSNENQEWQKPNQRIWKQTEKEQNIQLTAMVEELCQQVDHLESLVKSLHKKLEGLPDHNSTNTIHSKRPQTHEKAIQANSNASSDSETSTNHLSIATPKTPTSGKARDNISNLNYKKALTNSLSPKMSQKKKTNESASQQQMNENNLKNPSSQEKKDKVSQNLSTRQTSKLNLEDRASWFSTSGTILDSKQKVHSPHQEQNIKPMKSNLTPNINNAMTSDPPSAWIIHDSVFKNINANQLGHSYNFKATKIQANTIERIPKSFNQALEDLEFEPKPEIVVIQTGLNNLKTSDPESTATNMIKVIEEVQQHLPYSHILLHKIPPTRIRNLNLKAKVYNAILDRVSEPKPKVNTINSTLLASFINMKDQIHPNSRGTSILACTLGRIIRDHLWSIKKYSKHSFPKFR